MKTFNWHAIISGLVSGIAGILSYIAVAPPSLQTQIPQLFPEADRGTIGLWLKILMTIAGLYSAASLNKSTPTK